MKARNHSTSERDLRTSREAAFELARIVVDILRSAPVPIGLAVPIVCKGWPELLAEVRPREPISKKDFLALVKELGPPIDVLDVVAIFYLIDRYADDPGVVKSDGNAAFREWRETHPEAYREGRRELAKLLGRKDGESEQ